MTTLESIEGIGPARAAALRNAGVRSCEALLKQGGDKAGRKAIAAASGIDDGQILEWVNRADLMRIKGVSGQYSDLLEQAGVDTVRELSKRNAKNLAEAMAACNADRLAKTGKTIVRRVPSLKEVESWIAQAKQLPPGVSH